MRKVIAIAAILSIIGLGFSGCGKSPVIKIGIIAGKAEGAQRALDLMALAGVRGILNFTPARLKSPKVCIVNTVNLLHELENLVFFAQPYDRKEP